jgi:hypothetical protein
MIDHQHDHGRIQIETKPYKATIGDSIAFEVSPTGNGLYSRLCNAYEELLKDGEIVNESLLFPPDSNSKPKNKKRRR